MTKTLKQLIIEAYYKKDVHSLPLPLPWYVNTTMENLFVPCLKEWLTQKRRELVENGDQDEYVIDELLEELK